MGQTKNPERLMDDVLDVKIISDNVFMMDVRDKDGSVKRLVYEIDDPIIGKKIKAKIDYIK